MNKHLGEINWGAVTFYTVSIATLYLIARGAKAIAEDIKHHE